MLITVLGSGTSHGVPMLDCDCPVCRSNDPRDKRFRSSIWIRTDTVSLIVDTTPEFRLQALRAGIRHVDAVLYTHAHADHFLGFDDLRRFCEKMKSRLPIYGLPHTLEQIQHTFPYAFDPNMNVMTYVRVAPFPLDGEFSIGDLRITPLAVSHGKTPTCGFLFERAERKILAYFSDCKSMPEEVVQRIDGVEVFFIDGLRDQPHPTHLTSAEAVSLCLRVRARRSWLTHLTHHKSHKDREADLPEGVFAAYDGLEITP